MGNFRKDLLYSFFAKKRGLPGLWVLAAFLGLGGCQTRPAELSRSDIGVAPSQDLWVMSYNVENLFDTKHDKNKFDWTYLPRSAKGSGEQAEYCRMLEVKKWRRECENLDWSEKALSSKIVNLAEVIRSFRRGRGPDVLLLQEVENSAVLDQLARSIDGQRFRTRVLIEGEDNRGIDVAVLSDLPLADDPILHPLNLTSAGAQAVQDTRGILEVPLKLPLHERAGMRLNRGALKSATLGVFVFHMPAPYHPHEMRREAYQRLMQIMKAREKSYDVILAGGDGNVTREEEDRTQLLKTLTSGFVELPHFRGCVGCMGTYYYAPNRDWSYLDIFMFRNHAESPWVVDAKSFMVWTEGPEQLDRRGGPRSFDPETLKGSSDHFPIVLKLSPRIEHANTPR